MPFLDTTSLPGKFPQLPPNQLQPAQITSIPTLPSPLLQEQPDLLSSKIFTRFGPTDLRSHAPSIPQDLTHHYLPANLYGYNPYLILPFMLLSLAIIITIKIRILNANQKPLLGRFANWLRHAHKGTSRFRQKSTQASSVEKGGLAFSSIDGGGSGKRKAKRKQSQLRGPGIMLKDFATSISDRVKRCLRDVLQGRNKTDGMLVRSFDGEPLSPVVSRAWEPRFDDDFASEATFSGARLPDISLGPASAMPTLLPISESTISRIALRRPVSCTGKARRTKIASTISLADEGGKSPASECFETTSD